VPNLLSKAMVKRHFDLVQTSDKEPIRIEWFPEEIDDTEQSEHHWSMIEGWMPGVAEDGSEWRMWVQFSKEDSDSWEPLDEPELYEPAGTRKTITRLDYKNFYLDHWGEDGRKKIKSTYIDVPIKRYFHEHLGEAPNINPNNYKESLSRYVENDPARLLVYRMRWVPEELIGSKSNPESEFIRVQEDGETRVRATQKGLKKHLFLKQVERRFGKEDITRKIVKWLF